MSSVPFVLTVVVLFFVLWPCIYFAIEQTGLRNVNRVLAPAATILCILSMMGNFRTVQPESLIETILIPWAALGYSILFVLLLCLLRFLHGKVLRFFEGKSGSSEGADEVNRREVWGHYEERNVDIESIGYGNIEKHKQGALARGSERSLHE